MIKAVSKLDEVSFHMSGTEAIMCAVRLAAFNKRRKLVVCFAGAYHGWWDGVQPGPGNERKITDVLPLKDMSPASLAAIKARASEIACVVVNPLQGFNPNSPPPNDLVLMTSAIRKAASNETMDHYAVWLKTLRALCTECDVPLVFDEVYTGFRMAPGGAQEYYGVNADMVVYGKTLGGGMPVGVVCGKKELMRRFDPEHPLRVSYVIGTFSALPLTMGSMNAFLKWATSASARETYDRVGSEFDAWIKGTNVELKKANLPISVHNLTTVWTIIFDQPGRYHWMLQYYLRAEGIALSWVGTGRLLVSLDFQETDFATCRASLLRAAKRMKDDGWWNLGTAERPITAASISQGMGKEMAYHTVMKTVREGLLAEILCLPEQDGPRAQGCPPETMQEFYEEVMRRKADDHKASHSNCVNQFMHLISSTIFIFNYYTIWGDCTTTMVLGLFSLFSASRARYLRAPVPRRGGAPVGVQHPEQVLRRRGVHARAHRHAPAALRVCQLRAGARARRALVAARHPLLRAGAHRFAVDAVRVQDRHGVAGEAYHRPVHRRRRVLPQRAERVELAGLEDRGLGHLPGAPPRRP